MNLRTLMHITTLNNVILSLSTNLRGLYVYGLGLEKSICFSVLEYCYRSSFPTQALRQATRHILETLTKHEISHTVQEIFLSHSVS